MAKCPGNSCSKVDATTLDWFAIAQHNYDADRNDWPTEIMTREQGRRATFYLPHDLPSGAYLVRHAVWALHNNTGPVEGTRASPQHYPTGFEINLHSSGNNLPTLTGRLPGMFSYGDYEWNNDIYTTDLTKWEIPGVAVYSGGYIEGVVNGNMASGGAKIGGPRGAGENTNNGGGNQEVKPESTSAAPQVTATENLGNNHLQVTSSAADEASATATETATPTGEANHNNGNTEQQQGGKKQKVCKVWKSQQKKRSLHGARHAKAKRSRMH